jgi:hypothetical protein
MNKIVTEILNHLDSSEEARERFNSRNGDFELIKVKEPALKEPAHKAWNNDKDYYESLYLFDEGKQISLIEFGYTLDFLSINQKKMFIQTALSNTPDGKAVCEFLARDCWQITSLSHDSSTYWEHPEMQYYGSGDYEYQDEEGNQIRVGDIHTKKLQNVYFDTDIDGTTGLCTRVPAHYGYTAIALNQLLYNTINQALFNGKDFEAALEEANEFYLKNIKK